MKYLISMINNVSYTYGKPLTTLYRRSNMPIQDGRFLLGSSERYRRGLYREPFYSDSSDYNTNAKSYYDYLARYNGFIHEMVDFVNGLADDIQDLKDKCEAFNLSNEDITYTVGQAGDFKTINDCFDKINNFIVQPNSIRVILLKDYVMDEQLFLINKNYNHITITSENDIVTTKPTKTQRQIEVKTNPIFKVKPYFYSLNGVFPTIDFKLENKDFNDNINCGYLMDNSVLIFTEKGGATWFNFIGACAINGSSITANYCDFSQNGNREQQEENNNDQVMYGDGLRIFNSSLTGNYMHVHRCGEIGIHLSHGANGYIDYTEATYNGHHGLMTTTASQCSARNCKITDTTDDNVVAYAGSNIDLRYSDCSRSHTTYGVIATRSSNINFDSGTSNGSKLSGIMSNRGCSIDATGATASRNGEHGVIAANNSKVDFTSGNANENGQDGLQSTHGSIIQARLSTASRNKRNGVLAYAGSVYCQEITCDGNTRRGFESTRGGYIASYGAKISNSGDDNVLAYGSVISINEAVLTDAGRNAIEATRGGQIIADRVTINGTGDYGALAYGSEINMGNSEVSGTTNEPIYSTRGGLVRIFEPTITSDKTVFNVYNGSTIYTDNNEYSTNIDPNIMVSKGFILKG